MHAGEEKTDLKSLKSFLLSLELLLKSKVDGFTPKRTPVKCLLPHEILHSLSHHPSVFGSLMLGNLDSDSIAAFWNHCKKLGPWEKHPIFEEDCCLGKVVPLSIHGDGAQFFREDENFVYSISSLLAPSGIISDILLYKFPFLIIPERHMRSEAVARQNESPILFPMYFMTIATTRLGIVMFQTLWQQIWGLASIDRNFDLCHYMCGVDPFKNLSGHHIFFRPSPVPSQVAKAVNKTAADLAAWSINLAMKGTGPDKGFYGESLSGHRLEMAGKPLAQGWRFPA